MDSNRAGVLTIKGKRRAITPKVGSGGVEVTSRQDDAVVETLKAGQKKKKKMLWL